MGRRRNYGKIKLIYSRLRVKGAASCLEIVGICSPQNDDMKLKLKLVTLGLCVFWHSLEELVKFQNTQNRAPLMSSKCLINSPYTVTDILHYLDHNMQGGSRHTGQLSSLFPCNHQLPPRLLCLPPGNDKTYKCDIDIINAVMLF